jgi:translation elongation factor EF-Tu-like GTPase
MNGILTLTSRGTMSRRLSIVEDTFFIEGRGLILVPGIVPVVNERILIGDPIVLRRPDGTSLKSVIGGIEMIHRPMPSEDVVILLRGLTKEDVPIGTEVWTKQDG